MTYTVSSGTLNSTIPYSTEYSPCCSLTVPRENEPERAGTTFRYFFLNATTTFVTLFLAHTAAVLFLGRLFKNVAARCDFRTQ